MSTDITDGTPENDAPELVETIRYRPIRWDRFVEELKADYYNPEVRSVAMCRQMASVLDRMTALTTTDPEAGETVPASQSTRDLTVKTVTRLVQSVSGHLSPNSVVTMLRCVRRVCSLAVKLRHLAVSPFHLQSMGHWARPVRPQGKRHLTREEIRRILDVLARDVEAGKGWAQWKARRLQALVAVFAYTGLRHGEAIHLHVEDIDLPARMIRVRPRADHRLKTARSENAIPMPPALIPILESWLRHRLDAPPGFKMPASVPWVFPGARRKGPWTGGTDDKALNCFQRVALRAGVELATFQMLRRSLATHLRYFGVGAGVASKILRHSPEVDEAFYHEDDEANLRAAVENVEF